MKKIQILGGGCSKCKKLAEEAEKAVKSLNIEYEIELKGFDVFFIKQIIKTVKKFNLLNYVEFTSYPNYLISILKNYEKRARVGVFVSSYPSWMSALLGEKIILENLTLGKIDIAHCPINILNKKFIKDLKKRNILTHGADCNTAEDLRQAFLLKVNQLSTNDLDLAQKVRKKYGKI